MSDENKALKSKKLFGAKLNPLYRKGIAMFFLLFFVALASGFLISKQNSKKANSKRTTANKKKYITINIKPDAESCDEIASFLNQDPQPVVVKDPVSANRLRTLYVLRWLFEQENSFLLYVELESRKELLSPSMLALFTALKAYLSSNDISENLDIWATIDSASFYYKTFKMLLQSLTELNEQLARTIFESIVVLENNGLQKRTFLKKKPTEVVTIAGVINLVSSSEITFNQELYVFLETPIGIKSFDFNASFFKKTESEILDPEYQCFKFKPTYFVVTENSQEVAYFKRNNSWFKFDQESVTRIENADSFSQLHMIIFSIAKVSYVKCLE